MKRVVVVAGLLIALVLWRWSGPSALEHGAGVLAPDAPQQHALHGEPPFEHGAYRITPLARFALRARVLGREDYRFDAESGLSPTDLAFGWGRMSDSAVLEHLAIRQSGRFYHYRWGSDGPPIPAAEIVRSSANMHMVPADPGVAAMLGRVRRGDIVELQGQLIEAQRHDGWRWRSSLTRDDSGHGACELVWVTALVIEPAPG